MIYSLKIYANPQDFNETYLLFAEYGWIVDKLIYDPHGQLVILWNKRGSS